MRDRIHFRYLRAESDENRGIWRYETIYHDQLMETVNELARKGHSFFSWRRMGLSKAGVWTHVDPDIFLRLGPSEPFGETPRKKTYLQHASDYARGGAQIVQGFQRGL